MEKQVIENGKVNALEFHAQCVKAAMAKHGKAWKSDHVNTALEHGQAILGDAVKANTITVDEMLGASRELTNRFSNTSAMRQRFEKGGIIPPADCKPGAFEQRVAELV